MRRGLVSVWRRFWSLSWWWKGPAVGTVWLLGLLATVAVVVAEFPNDEVYATTLLAIASRGAVNTTTLKAFTEDEYRRIIAAIP